ncbi:hypothetical protein A3860_29330 [Niastella vici]|uniref:Uncharacterized protein n=1 Tax=Niastella vici TaxID=1703345 RepID=A0A1V9FUS4_9BACT|nr:BNR-repeat neuraminidase N-terminal domain-containing protein [Niastella vici]OQP62058.1 hypothetical protein A3860_29330 [Niastella vici]
MRTILNQSFGKVALLWLATLFTAVTEAQIQYGFTAATGTFTPNTGATTLYSAGTDDELSAAQNIGFTFVYGCNSYTQFKVCSNGFISLGAAATNNTYTNALATTGQGPLIAPLWDDLVVGTGGSVNYVLTGTAPNRVLTVEWLNMKWNYQAPVASTSFQVKLYETSNVIEFIYRRESTTLNNPTASIGINGGSSATDYYSLNGTGTAPAAVYGIEKYDLNSQPASNQVYRFVPGIGTVTAVQASTAAVPKCEQNQVILGVQVTVSSCAASQSLTQLQFNMTGSTIAGTNTNDVSKIHIYYTGNSAVAATANEFVSGGVTPATGTVTASGSQALVSGINYFWIVYDINTATATTGNVLDAQCTQLTITGLNYTPVTTNPAGNRAIAACAIAPGSVKSNLAFWVKANAGTSSTVNTTALTLWSDQSGNSRNATSAVAATSPVYYDNSTNNINFNPVVNFDAAAQNTALADFMDISSNGILSSGNNPYTVYAVLKPGTGNLSTPGKFLFSGIFDAAGNTFNSFDIRSNTSFNDSWCLNDLISTGQWTASYPSLATYDFNSVQRQMFNAGTSVGAKVGSARNSSDLNCALGCQRAVTPNKEFYDGGIAEIISYANTSHDATTRYKIESYLAIKYGVTLSHNYLSSVGTTVWNRSINTVYNNNIIGIAQDNNSGLNQKQSKSTAVVPDILTLYVGPSKIVNQAGNTGTFTAGDQSFFMAAHNGDPYLYTGAATEVPAGICCRLQREWLSQKTNFTNTDLKLEFDFNVITPGYSPLNTADLRLLVDNDGNFTNATILGSPAVTITVSASVVTVTVPAANFTSTPYFTLASVSASTPLPLRFVKLNANCAGSTAQINFTTENEINTDRYSIERSADGRNFTPLADVKSRAATGQQSYRWTDAAPLAGTSYYRIKTTGADNTTSYSSIMTFVDCGTELVRLATDATSGESELFLQLSQHAAVELALFDAMGRRYAVPGVTGKQNMTQGTYRFPVTGTLKTGVYMLSLSINENKRVFRLVKQ